MPTPVGFIGLGQIGRPMARNLIAPEFELTVHDLDAEAVDALTSLGAVSTASPRELAERSEIALVCVRDDAQVEAVVCGDDGLLAGSRSDLVIVVHSTVHPQLITQLAERARAASVKLIDAQMTGAAVGAENRELCLMVGGEASVVERCRPVFEASASHIVHVGPVGAGATAKLSLNLMTYIAWLGAFEGALLADRAGLSMQALTAVLEANGLMSLPLRRYLDISPWDEEAVDHPAFQDAMHDATTLAEKDLALALSLANGMGVALPATALCQQLMARVYGLADPDRR